MLNNHITKLSLGTAQFGLPYGIANKSGIPNDLELTEIISSARAHGIDSIDTARAYGDAETRLGQTGISDFLVTAKISNTSNINDQVTASLSSLGVPKLHAVLLHDEMALLGDDSDEIYKCLSQLKESGIVENIGVSFYSPDVAHEILSIFDLDVIQAPVNVLDRRFLDKKLTDFLLEKRVKMQARSIFLQGLLLDPEASKRLPPEIDRTPLEKWFDWVGHQKQRATSLALGFVLASPVLETAVVGVENARQLEQVIRISNHLSMDEYPDLGASEQLLDPRRWQ